MHWLEKYIEYIKWGFLGHLKSHLKFFFKICYIRTRNIYTLHSVVLSMEHMGGGIHCICIRLNEIKK